MKFVSILALTLACLMASCQNEKTSYKGYKLYRVYPNNAEDIKHIQAMENEDPNFDVWHADKEHVDIMLSPSNGFVYKMIFDKRNMKYEIIQDDVQSFIDLQEKSMIENKSGKIINTFARYSAVLSFLDDIVDANPDIASTYNAGFTIDGRQLKVLKLKTPTAGRAIWIDAGIHAREWVSPSACIAFIDRFINEYRSNDPQVVALLNRYEFHIIPLMNPDGYEFSHTTTRLWRKNRRVNSGSTCMGVDLNRNYNFQWNPNSGASPLPCSETYAGSGANSEPETQAIIAAINAKAGEWDAYLSLHTYGNYWLSPYGYSTTAPPTNTDLQAKAKIGVDAIFSVHREIFTYGPSSTQLYINSGSSKDWAYGAAGIKYSYVLELRPGPSSPDYGFAFQLPVDRMPLVSNETYVGIKAFLNAI